MNIKLDIRVSLGESREKSKLGQFPRLFIFDILDINEQAFDLP